MDYRYHLRLCTMESPMKTQASFLFVLAAACLPLTLGCSAAGPPVAAGLDAAPEVTEPPTSQATSRGGPEVLVSGTLNLDEGCVSLLGEDGSKTNLLFSSMGAPTILGTALNYDGARYEGGGLGVLDNASIASQCGGINQACFTVSQPSHREYS